MSAITLVREESAVHIVTDGAAFIGDRVVGYATKQLPIPHLPAVVAVRGTSVATYSMWGFASTHFADYDDMKARFAGLVRKSLLCRWWNLEVVVAGYSASSGIDAYTFASRDRKNIPAWESAGIPSTLFAPEFDHCLNLRATFRNKNCTVEEFAERACDSQRAAYGTTGLGSHLHSAGMFCQMTTLTHETITTRILKRYPDEIGKPIRPYEDVN
jgi:hypothetical protein